MTKFFCNGKQGFCDKDEDSYCTDCPHCNSTGGYYVEVKTKNNDAVSVVRCKDCKHGEIDDPYFPDQYYCHEGCGWNKSDFWCAYGERRADNG